jgi:hypothetical protein
LRDQLVELFRYLILAGPTGSVENQASALVEQHEVRCRAHAILLDVCARFRRVYVHADDSRLALVPFFESTHGALDALADDSPIRVERHQRGLIQLRALGGLQTRNVRVCRMAALFDRNRIRCAIAVGRGSQRQVSAQDPKRDDEQNADDCNVYRVSQVSLEITLWPVLQMLSLGH